MKYYIDFNYNSTQVLIDFYKTDNGKKLNYSKLSSYTGYKYNGSSPKNHAYSLNVVRFIIKQTRQIKLKANSYPKLYRTKLNIHAIN